MKSVGGSHSGYNAGGNQLFQIVLTASSTWKIVNVFTGKAVTNSGSGITQQTFSNASAQLWGIDDHNGHFKLINKSSGNALQVPSGNNTPGTAGQQRLLQRRRQPGLGHRRRPPVSAPR